MTEHTVTLVEDDEETELTVDEEETILEAAEAVDVDIPNSCRAGACTNCVGRVLEGSIDQSKATGLDPTQIEEGYALMCVGKPESDCRIEVAVQEELFEL